ncbi:hypothetical protein A5643_00280 [Mycobacterium sp. 1274756.6]|nr:hypothetical protein A5643_00280 [Mycobacterium sp. 1274756.6]
MAAAVERGAGIVPPQLPAGGEVELLHRIVWGLGGAGQVNYAAAVIEIAGGRQVVLTSDRGRGWLPAGALVPVAAVNPWTHRAAAAWIGVADPVRVLTEYAAAVGGELAAVVATRGQLPAGVAAERAEAREVAHATLTVPTCGRVAWQAGDLAATVERWPARDDLHRQAMGCAWLAHTSAPDPRGRRAAVLDAIFTRHHAGMRGDPRIDVTGWEPLWQRWSAASVAEARARYDATQVPVGALDGTAAAEHSPQLAVLLADEATLALRQPGPAALEAALYAAAMCRAT